MTLERGLLFMAIPAYLLVGCILMLIVNELMDGAMTRKEFVRGMIVWPLCIGYLLDGWRRG